MSDGNEIRVCGDGGTKQNRDTVFLMKPEGPSPSAQQPANRPCQQSVKSSSQLQPYLHRSILTLPTLISNCVVFRSNFCRLFITHMLHTSQRRPFVVRLYPLVCGRPNVKHKHVYECRSIIELGHPK